MKNKLFYIVLVLFVFLGMLKPSYAASKENLEYATGRVLAITSQVNNKILEETIGGQQISQLVKVKVLSGKYKGKIVDIENQLTSNPAYDIKINNGDRVILDIEKNGKQLEFYIADNERIPSLMIIAGLFLSLLLIIGRFKGLKSIISTGITCFLVFFVLIPAILNNYPIIPTTVALTIVSTLLTMSIISGLNRKSISASIGTLGGVLAAALISMLVIKIAPLTGFSTQESIMLWSSRPDLNYTGLLTAAMIIGSLGAIMDIGISIASSVDELKKMNSDLNPKQLIKSGMNVGMDIMGAMANTLILAYIGSALPLVLLAADVPLVKLINLNTISTEITAAIAGSIGIILSVPLTAVVSGYLIGNRKSIISTPPLYPLLKEEE